MKPSNSTWAHARGRTGLRPVSSRVPQWAGIDMERSVLALVRLTVPSSTPTWVDLLSDATNQSAEGECMEAVPTVVETA